ncbi:hypothetical protein HIM_00347 [Hirsutella minnesotensis 3608]|nr:hypothetical protein HIM_00347 [Hirsutella minnesotensis 3608]
MRPTKASTATLAPPTLPHAARMLPAVSVGRSSVELVGRRPAAPLEPTASMSSAVSPSAVRSEGVTVSFGARVPVAQPVGAAPLGTFGDAASVVAAPLQVPRPGAVSLTLVCAPFFDAVVCQKSVVTKNGFLRNMETGREAWADSRNSAQYAYRPGILPRMSCGHLAPPTILALHRISTRL